MQSFVEKITSRKFLLAFAAFLGSLGAGITGLATGNEAVALTGGILMVFSAAIYAACEAYVDGKSAESTKVNLQIDAKPVKVDDAERLLNLVIAPDNCNTEAVSDTKETADGQAN